MSNFYVEPKANQCPPYFEYVMSKDMAQNLLNNRGEKDLYMRPHDYLVMIVNEQFGIQGTCVKVSLG